LKALSISILVILLDQGSKLYIKGFKIPLLNFEHAGLRNGESIPVIQDFFHITMIENPGIAFGFSLGPQFKLIISIFTIAASVGLLVYFFMIKDKSLSLRISTAVIIGGAFSNLIDRVFYGYFYGYATFLEGSVVDFLDLRLFSIFLFNRSFGAYVFNVADLAITIGVFCLLFSLRRKKESATSELVPVSESFFKEQKFE
jgi:signal peptidase II